MHHIQHISGSKPQNNTKSQGYVLILAIIVTFVLTTIGVTLATVASAKYSKTKRDVYVVAANYAAEAGISDTISRLNDDEAFTGYFPDDPINSKEYYNNTDGGRAVYNTKVTDITGNTAKTIIATGKVYVPSTAATPINTKTIEVTVNKNSDPSSSAVVAGHGGLTLEANSTLAAANVFSSGKISLLSGAGTIGTSSEPTQVSAANAACTSTSGYFPSICPSSDPAIAIQGGAGGIIGSVCAANQPAITGIDASKLDNSCSPPRTVVDTSNRASLYNNLSLYTGASSCTSNVSASLPSNIRVQNNVVISGGCDVTINGNVYIQGDLTISGASTRVFVSESFTNIPVVVMATGTITIDGAQINKNSKGASVRFISFKTNSTSTDPSVNCAYNQTCTKLPDPTTVLPSANTDAIICRNGCKANYAQLTAYFGKVVLHGTSVNQSYARSVAGQSILVQSNSGTVNVSNPPGETLSDVVSSRWAVVEYRQVYN